MHNVHNTPCMLASAVIVLVADYMLLLKPRLEYKK